MAGLKVYYDLMSQPSRAVYMFVKLNNIPFEAKPIALRSGEHLKDEYKAINPFSLVPVIDDHGFKLTESVAILKYLCSKFNVADHWYPQDFQKRARVDEYMAWQQYNLRPAGSMVFRAQPGVARHWYPTEAHLRARVDEFAAWQHTNLHTLTTDMFNLQVIEPRAKNIPVDQERLRKFKADFEVTLQRLENVFLKDHDYLCGDDITIADLLGICELMQPYATLYDLGQGRPKLAAYIERVKARLQPTFDEANVMVTKIRKMFSESKM